MKRFVLSLAAACCMFASASAQQAFKHLSIGLDVSTTGVGLELALPVVTDHLVIAAGYNYLPSLSGLSMSQNLDVSELNKTVNEVNSKLAQIPGETMRINQFSPAQMSASPALKLGTGRVVLEYYPAKKSSFHITAGAYFGPSQVLAINANISDTFWKEYSQLKADVDVLNAKYKDTPGSGFPVEVASSMKFNVNQRTLEINDTNKKSVNVGLSALTVRPYLGIGFGRSIPETHFGFQFDMGVWYHGKMNLSSANEVAYDSSAKSMDVDLSMLNFVQNLCVYPNLSFRLIYRIF